jgi:hypothetical protein
MLPNSTAFPAGATLLWEHDCDAEQTSIIYIAASKGWIGLGLLVPSKVQSQHMVGADIYQVSVCVCDAAPINKLSSVFCTVC